MKKRTRTQTLVILSLFVALAYASQLIVHIKVMYLSFDPKDAIITVGAMIYGPIAGLVMSFAVAAIEALTNGSTQFWGFFMNVLSSAVFSFVASFVYKKWRSSVGAALGLALSVILTTLVMLPANYFITPLFSGTTSSEVAKLIPTLLLPFNLVKTLFNAGLVFVIYKPIVRTLRSAHILPQIDTPDRIPTKKTKKRFPITLVLGVLFIVCAAVGFVLLHGRVEFF